MESPEHLFGEVPPSSFPSAGGRRTPIRTDGKPRAGNGPFGDRTCPHRNYGSCNRIGATAVAKVNINTEPEEHTMRIAKKDIPVRIDVPGAVARQKTNFGDATGYGRISGEYFSLGAGTDISPLLEGLEGDLCQSPHWGYLLQGKLTVTFADGAQEVVNSGDLFYWPPGHTVKVGEDAEAILFSPQDEHSKVIDHMRLKMGA